MSKLGGPISQERQTPARHPFVQASLTGSLEGIKTSAEKDYASSRKTLRPQPNISCYTIATLLHTPAGCPTLFQTKTGKMPLAIKKPPIVTLQRQLRTC